MKWIGQLIYDQTSRFRNDVYLEGIATGTIASGGNLGLDSNNKIVKATVSGGGGGTPTDITVANEGTDTTCFPLFVTAATGDLGPKTNSNLSFNSNTSTLSCLGFSGNFVGDLTGTADSADTLATARTIAGVSFNGSANISLNNNAITNGAGYTTNVGDVTLAGEQTFTGVKTFGTTNKLQFRDANAYINSPTANDLEISATDITLDAADGISLEIGDTKNISFVNGTNTFGSLNAEDGNLSTFRLNEQGGSSTADFFSISVAEHGDTKLTTHDHGGERAHFEVEADGNITLDATGDIVLEAGGDDLTLDANKFTFTSATSQKPEIQIVDSTNDADGSRLKLIKDRNGNGSAGVDNDLISAIQYASYNNASTPEYIVYSQILSNIVDKTDGQEGGSMRLQVAAHGGGLETGLTLTGGSQDDEVDVTVGLGTSSLTTVAGNLEVTTGVELGHASDTTLSRSASGTLAVEGKNVRTEDKTIMIKQGSFASGSGGFSAGAVTYFPMTGTAENSSANGTAQPFLAPANGKLLKLHFRSNKDHDVNADGSGGTHIFTLRNWDDDEQFTDGNKTILAQKTVGGVEKNAVLTVDFRSSLDVTVNADTNEFTEGETLCIGMENSFDTNATTKYYFTAVFEFDFSSY